MKKIIPLTSLIISIGLLSGHASNTTPLNQSSVAVNKYSNISGYAGSRDTVSGSSNKLPLSESTSVSIVNFNLFPKLMMPPMEEAERAIEKLDIGKPMVSKVDDLENTARVGSLSSSDSIISATISLSHPKEIALGKNEKAILPDSVDRIGLDNGGDDCFINSSLQLLKALKLQPPSEPPNAWSHLTKFINNDPKLNCKKLRRELANRVMVGTQEFQNVVSHINNIGSAGEQHDATEFLNILLEKVNAPQVHFQNIITRVGNQVDTSGEVQERILSLGIPEHEGIGMQELIDLYVKDEVPKEESAIIKEEKKLKEPVPQTVVISVKRFGNAGQKRQDVVHGILNAMTLPLENGEQAIYQPNAIICHINSNSANNGHYICYRKEGNVWWKFNDSVVTEATDEDINDTIPRNCYVISYVRSNTHAGEVDDNIYNNAEDSGNVEKKDIKVKEWLENNREKLEFQLLVIDAIKATLDQVLNNLDPCETMHQKKSLDAEEFENLINELLISEFGLTKKDNLLKNQKNQWEAIADNAKRHKENFLEKQQALETKNTNIEILSKNCKEHQENRDNDKKSIKEENINEVTRDARNIFQQIFNIEDIKGNILSAARKDSQTAYEKIEVAKKSITNNNITEKGLRVLSEEFEKAKVNAKKKVEEALSVEKELTLKLKQLGGQYLNSISPLSALETFDISWVEAQQTAKISQAAWLTAQEAINAAKNLKIDWVEKFLRLAEKSCSKRARNNFNLGETTKREGGILARRWLGNGLQELTLNDGKKALMSHDKLKRVRLPDYKQKEGKYQMNFERRVHASEEWTRETETLGNGHLTIINPYADDLQESSIFLNTKPDSIKSEELYLEEEEELQTKANKLYEKALYDKSDLLISNISGDDFNNDEKTDSTTFLKQNFDQCLQKIWPLATCEKNITIKQQCEDIWKPVIDHCNDCLKQAPDSKKDWWKHFLERIELHKFSKEIDWLAYHQSNITKYSEKAQEAKNKNYDELSELWEQLAAQEGSIIECEKEVNEAAKLNNTQKSEESHDRLRLLRNRRSAMIHCSYDFRFATEALEKAIIAESGDAELAKLQREISGRFKHAAEYYKQLADACVLELEGKLTICPRHYLETAQLAECSAWALEKAIEAKDEALKGDLSDNLLWNEKSNQYYTIATLLEETFNLYEYAIKFYKKSIEMYNSEKQCGKSPVKPSLGLDLIEKRPRFYERLKIQINLEQEVLSNSADIIDLAKNDYNKRGDFCLQSVFQSEKAARSLMNVSKKDPIFNIDSFKKSNQYWKEAAGKYKNASSNWNQYIQKREDSLKAAALRYQEAADENQRKAVIAESEVETNKARAQGSKYIADWEKITDFYNKVDISCNGIGNREYKYWAAQSALNAAEQLEQAIKEDTNGQTDIANSWRKIAEQSQLAYIAYSQFINKYAEGKKEESGLWKWAAESAFYAAEQLEKAVKEEANGKIDIANSCKDAAKLYQQAYLAYFQSTKEYFERKEEGKKLWVDIAKSAFYAAKGLRQSIQNETKGQTDIAESLKNMAKHYQLAYEAYQSINEYTEREENKKLATWASQNIFNAALQLELAIEDDASGRTNIGNSRRDLAKENRLAYEANIQSINKYDEGKEKEGEHFKRTAQKHVEAAKKLFNQLPKARK